VDVRGLNPAGPTVGTVTSPAETCEGEGSPPVPLLAPRDGVPAVVSSAAALAGTIEAFAAGRGPVAVDAERASGYRYGQRAYLIQLRRAGVGTALVDPIACPELSGLAAAIGDAEWVLHAANQDIPCLADVGLRAARLFDTELAGRLLGFPRVGLGAMVESVLGFSLEKGHSAVDWSTRPLPEPWLRYAALDVEVLIELRDALEEQLRRQGKLAWAHEEFAAIASSPLPPPRKDPWRRVSGLHRVRRPRQLAVVRSLWEARDRMAQERDLAPGRVLPDSAIVDAALSMPATVDVLAAMPVFGGRSNRRSANVWFAAVEAARQLPDGELPQSTMPNNVPPPARSWADRDPAAAERLATLRAAVAAIADEHGLPTENLVAPDSIRRIAWQPPEDLSTEHMGATLAGFGVRRWQIELTAKVISRALDRLRTRSEIG